MRKEDGRRLSTETSSCGKDHCTRPLDVAQWFVHPRLAWRRSHLDELRDRLVRALLAVAVGKVIDIYQTFELHLTGGAVSNLGDTGDSAR